MAMLELVDVVDVEDRVLRQVAVDEAHRDGLLHRFVQVLLTDRDGRLILQQRTPDLFYPLTFDGSVGEHVSAGESYAVAAVRGLREELGITVEVELEDLGRIENHTVPENMIGRLLVGRYDGEVVFQESEIVRVERMTRDEAALFLARFPYLLCANLRASLGLYLEKVKG